MGKGGGIGFFIVNKVWGLVAGLTILFAVMVFLIGPSSTASFGKTAVGAVGTGLGVTIGSIPHFVDSMKAGQKAVGGDSKSTSKKGGGK